MPDNTLCKMITFQGRFREDFQTNLVPWMCPRGGYNLAGSVDQQAVNVPGQRGDGVPVWGAGGRSFLFNAAGFRSLERAGG